MAGEGQRQKKLKCANARRTGTAMRPHAVLGSLKLEPVKGDGVADHRESPDQRAKELDVLNFE